MNSLDTMKEIFKLLYFIGFEIRKNNTRDIDTIFIFNTKNRYKIYFYTSSYNISLYKNSYLTVNVTQKNIELLLEYLKKEFTNEIRKNKIKYLIANG